MMKQTIAQGMQHSTQQQIYSQPLTTRSQALTQPPSQSRDEQLRELRKQAAARTTAKRESYLKEKAEQERREEEFRIRENEAIARYAEEARQQAIENGINETNRELRALERASWAVNLEGMCAKSIGESNISGKKIEIYGMAWIRARVIDKSNGQNRQIDVSPWGGFTRVNGDKERVWEIRPSNAVNFGRVGSYDYSLSLIHI